MWFEKLWLSLIVIHYKIIHSKIKNVKLVGQKRENRTTHQMKNKFSKQPYDVVRGFLCQLSVI